MKEKTEQDVFVWGVRVGEKFHSFFVSIVETVVSGNIPKKIFLKYFRPVFGLESFALFVSPETHTLLSAVLYRSSQMNGDVI